MLLEFESLRLRHFYFRESLTKSKTPLTSGVLAFLFSDPIDRNSSELNRPSYKKTYMNGREDLKRPWESCDKNSSPWSHHDWWTLGAIRRGFSLSQEFIAVSFVRSLGDNRFSLTIPTAYPLKFQAVSQEGGSRSPASRSRFEMKRQNRL